MERQKCFYLEQLEVGIENVRSYGGNDMIVYFNEEDLVDDIARFFEKEENWNKLKDCWLIDGRSEDLRVLLHKAVKE